MFRMNKFVSTIVLACFLFNTAFSDLAFGLATPLVSSDIVGIQHKDMGRIKIALEEQLVGVLGPLVNKGLPQADTGIFLRTVLKEQHVKENTIFHPADMQFLFQEAKSIGVGLCVKVILKDKYGLRTYYTVFSLEKDKDGGFPIKVYTEEQYKATAELAKGLPPLKEKDIKAINRYVEQNEKIIDPWIAEHMKDPDNYIEIKHKSYGDIGDDFLSTIHRADPYSYDDLDSIFPSGIRNLLVTLMMQRKIVIIKVKKGEKRPVITEIGKDCKEKKIEVGSHASQNGVYIFLDEEGSGKSEGLLMFENLKGFLMHAGMGDVQATSAAVDESILPRIFHEMGVALELDYEVTKDSKIINDMDRLYEMAYIDHKNMDLLYV